MRLQSRYRVSNPFLVLKDQSDKVQVPAVLPLSRCGVNLEAF